MNSAIVAILSLIEALIPSLTSSASTVTMVDNIITALTNLMPLIVNEISSLYTATKNVISLLQGSDAVTADQQAALQALDAQVDTAWNAQQAQFDPDYVPPGTTTGAATS